MTQPNQPTEFSFDFAEKMLVGAKLLGEHHDGENETARAVVYMSCVSIEVSMKSLLEQSGMPYKAIRKLSHRLIDLLNTVDSLHEGGSELEPHKNLWSEVVNDDIQNGSVGLLLSLANEGSAYPNEMRYGEVVKSISPPILMLDMAKVVLHWCRSHAGQLNYIAPQPEPA